MAHIIPTCSCGQGIYSSSKLVLASAVVALGYALSRSPKRDAREPPAVGGQQHPLYRTPGGIVTARDRVFWDFSVPSVSHLLLGPDIEQNLSGHVPGSLLQAIQRNNKTITFDPFITFTAERIAGIHGSSLNLLREKRAGGHGLNQAVVHAMHPTLTGRSLDRMNERMARRLCPLIDELAHCKTVDLYAWCSRTITAAKHGCVVWAVEPLSGSKDCRCVLVGICSLDSKKKQNNPKLIRSRAFETHLSPMLANFLPWITARTAWKGRETAVAALVKYFERNGHQGGSELTQVRWRTMHEAGLPVEDIARAEVSMALGLLSNTAPASFWILYDLYSRPALLQEIRREIQAHALRVNPDSTTHTHHRYLRAARWLPAPRVDGPGDPAHAVDHRANAHRHAGCPRRRQIPSPSRRRDQHARAVSRSPQ
ncbi:hypothetical protein ARAM_001823 [Aspergillus rambellii]|uniref:Cytochrome P450 n=1 Tax=Aspergillus rambellii TaxID=308745 RepID=A0A0F8V2M6_9EURO|nr:hypothetical protein ARAM_001823 [Aspergillus rambellii]